MRPRQRQSASASAPAPHALGAALLLALAVLPGCSTIALPQEVAPAAGADPSDVKLIADHIRAVFKDHAAANEAYEISGARWVHALHGWNWLTCVRFQDHGRRRTYAVFVKDHAVVDSRYAVQTDACDAQTYVPFDALRPAGPGAQGPIY